MQYNCYAYLKRNMAYTIYKCIAEVIKIKKFKIPSIPPTTNKCIRFPNNVIEEVEKAIQGKDCTFTAFVVEAVKIALENLKEEEK